MVWPMCHGPAVVSVLVIETSAEVLAVPPLPLLSVLLPVFGSVSVAETLALLSKAPVAVTVMVTFAPLLIDGIVHGSAAQPPPVSSVIYRFVGVSVTWTFVAVEGPALATKSV